MKKLGLALLVMLFFVGNVWAFRTCPAEYRGKKFTGAEARPRSFMSKKWSIYCYYDGRQEGPPIYVDHLRGNCWPESGKIRECKNVKTKGDPCYGDNARRLQCGGE